MARSRIPNGVWGMFALATLLVVAAVVMTLHADRQRTRVSNSVRTNESLEALRESVLDLGHAVVRASTGEASDCRSRVAASTDRTEALRRDPALSAESRRHLEQLAGVISEMERTCAALETDRPTGPPAAEIRARHEAAFGRALDSLDTAGRILRHRLAVDSARLDAHWGRLSVLVPVAGLLVLFACGLLFRHRKQLIEQQRAALEARRQAEVFRAIVDNLGDGVAVADENRRLTMLNPAAERILGLGIISSGPERWSELYGLYRPDGRTPIPVDELPLARAVAGDESRDFEMFVRNPRIEAGTFIRVTATPLRDAEGRSMGGVAVFRDISERKWTEALLRDSEARFRSIVEATPSALIILGPDRRILELNPMAEAIFGKRRDEAMGRDFLEMCLPAEFHRAVAEDIERALAGDATPGFEVPTQAAGGHEKSLLWSFSRLGQWEKRGVSIIAVGIDITQRREAEEAWRVRELAAHLQSAREHERGHIAREIHDEFGQALTGLKLQVSHLSRLGFADAEDLRRRLVELGKTIDNTIESVRQLASELRPHILDELGLLDAIRWQAREFERRVGVACVVELPDEEPGWSQERATAIFRIVQEALTNVARHAGAKRVGIRMRPDNGRMVVQVQDDGRGITAEQVANARSFGLLGMRERVRMFGGTLSIEGQPARGTLLTLTVPL